MSGKLQIMVKYFQIFTWEEKYRTVWKTLDHDHLLLDLYLGGEVQNCLDKLQIMITSFQMNPLLEGDQRRSEQQETKYSDSNLLQNNSKFDPNNLKEMGAMITNLFF